MRGGLGEVFVLEGPATLLVRGEKCIGQRIGLCRCRLIADTDGQYKTGHPINTPALAHTEKRQQQQRPAQPVTGILPVQLSLFIAGTLEMLLGVEIDPIQVVVVERQAAQRRVQG
ncbi:hypothetical protein D3C76_1334450 [compost metagenome]